MQTMALATPVPAPVPVLPVPAPNRIPVTRAFCKLLQENNLLPDRYELIDGEIISKMGQNPPHALTVMLVTIWMMRIFGERYVRCQLTLNIENADSEVNAPEPDVVALNQPVTAFGANHPTPADVLLVVEVSDTTLQFDLQRKALLYSRAGVAAYWVADVTGRRLITHRNPTPTGYGEIVEYGVEDTVTLADRPNDTLRVADLFTPAQT